ncbi:GntR family transcriptional regulator [Agrococcus jejuensis]|uniref:GntR family transcriptional regulator n=1 Tax=Agrococcus jejuensis TaxID=399736 RepID=UPI0011A183A2|nr:GntR family transcriptional regulator [Agrococcus jejuensis]
MSEGGRHLDVQRRALRDQVHDRILADLLLGTVQPGERLSIDTLARELDVSPTPVREALVQLERTGLVTREALKGYRVAPPLDAEQLTELFEARMMLEERAAALAASQAEALLPALRAAHEVHEAASHDVVRAHAAGEVPLEVTQRYFEADGAFHAVILDHSGNRYLQEMHASLGALTHRLRQAALRGPSDVIEALAEHRAIVEAYAAAPEAAGEAMRAHVANVRDRSLSGR